MYSKDIEQLGLKVLENLSSKQTNATPKAYESEFCKLSKEIKLSTKECDYFQNALKHLSTEEKQLDKKEIETSYDLIDVLLQRIEKKNLQKMSSLVANSLRPSISLQLDKDLEAFCIKIDDSPALILEDSIQHKIGEFIEKRFEVDKKVVAQKTADIARLITLMSKYLNDAISSGKKSSSNISHIQKQLKEMKENNKKEDLNTIQNQLENAAKNIQYELDSVNSNFVSSHDEIEKLKNRIDELEKELKETKQQNTLDHLTQTLNRRAFDKKLIEFDEKYTRVKNNYALVFFDIDYFKKVNDNYGHECGDVILKTFAAILKKLTRDIDIVARYGGEEFVSLIHYDKKEELHAYLKRIKNIIGQNKFIYKDLKLKITFSAGVELRSNHKEKEELVVKADQLLYQAKQSGRDKIVFWDQSII